MARRLLFVGMGKAKHYQSATVRIWYAGEVREVDEGTANYLLDSFPGCFVEQSREPQQAAGPMKSPRRAVVEAAPTTRSLDDLSLDELKEAADAVGVSYGNRISETTLRKRIALATGG